MNRNHIRALDLLGKGRLSNAEAVALSWSHEEPNEILAGLLVAECRTLQGNSAGALDSLERCAEINRDHPMFFRMVCLAALGAEAFTAAHGALYSARLVGLPPSIIEDLEVLLRERALVNGTGTFATPENSDPRWRALLGRPWHARDDKVRLSWAEIDDKFWIFNTEVVNVAFALASGAGAKVWNSDDGAAAVARLWVPVWDARPLGEIGPEPWMCGCLQGVYLSMALHLAGEFPQVATADFTRTETADGALDFVFSGRQISCFASSSAILERLARMLPNLLAGRVSLVGPDAVLKSALPWLTSKAPCHDDVFG